jgi:circadian clock protein KaiC
LASSGIPALDQLLGDGYPDSSTILVVGSPGIGKEALAFWFIRSGLIQGDYCLYVTHRPVVDVLKDMKGFGIPGDRVPEWIASSGSETKCDLRDYTSISYNIKQAIQRNKGRRIRVVSDVISPLLVLNPPSTMYEYWSSLLGELKQNNCVVLALAEEGMHPPATVAALEQQFDGVIEMKAYEEGLSFISLLRVRKMLGIKPLQGYFRYSFSTTGMEVVPYVK